MYPCFPLLARSRWGKGLGVTDAGTVIERLAAGSDHAPAVGAPDRLDLSHGALRELMRETAEDLGRLGYGRGRRIAIVLPNGPEMATAFVAVAAAATTAPLNPAYKEDELDFYLSDIGADALLVAAGDDGAAVVA